MSPQVVVLGTLSPDGTLELDGKVPLPAGRVLVIVQPLPQLPKDDPFWQMMQRIWDEQRARGHVPRSVEEVEGQRRALQEEMEEEIREATRLQEDSRRLRREAEEKERGGG